MAPNKYKRLMTNVKKVIKHPTSIMTYLASRNIIPYDDKSYIEHKFYEEFDRKLDLNNPQTFNEKIQWLKLYDQKPEYTEMVDKFEVKKYIADAIGEEYIIPTLGIYNNFDEIDFNKLPNQFVIKCTHDSGSIIICKDKSTFDRKKAKKKINKWLKRNYYYHSREWSYKNVKPRIIIEKYMVDESGTELKDYKIFCFNGEPKFIEVDFGRFSDHKRNLYTLDWELLDLEIKYPSDPQKVIKRPNHLEKMIEFSRILSKNIPHVRVDLYSINNKIYFGELTFYHGSGLEKIEPVEWDKKLGDMLKLP